MDFEERFHGQGSCYCFQLPLCLAWSLTVQKLQGAELDYMIFDVTGGCWEAGQAYVGLLQVRSSLGLQVVNFLPNDIKTDPLVDRFERVWAQNCLQSFLESEAGMWWYPLLDKADIINHVVYTNCKKGQDVSSLYGRRYLQQFLKWMQMYGPLPEYKGINRPHSNRWKNILDGERLDDYGLALALAVASSSKKQSAGDLTAEEQKAKCLKQEQRQIKNLKKLAKKHKEHY